MTRTSTAGRVLIGIDAGTTVTKAVVFDLAGRPLGSASARVPLAYPKPHWVERDQGELLAAIAEVTREAVARAKVAPADVATLGLTSHGDGIYLVDETGKQVRPGIMSLDTRATGVVAEWEAMGVADEAFELTGQRPWPSSPAALLAWLDRWEPEVVSRARWALPAKDAMRFALTGVVSTEPTEASLSFTNVLTQAYDDEVLATYRLSHLSSMLPRSLPCASAPGGLTVEAAEALGLVPGTPVAAGAHDVDCSAVGTGVLMPGLMSVVAGSFSINQTVSREPIVGSDWYARNFVTPGTWLNMSISPTSSATMEWFTQALCAEDLARGVQEGDPFGFVEREVAAIEADPSDITFLPFVFGSPPGISGSGTFLGLQAWHGRGHLLRAVMEGVALTHRLHVEHLLEAFPCSTVRLTGGATRSRRWCQMFADILGLPVEVTSAEESGAWGVAMLAGVAVGCFADLAEAVERSVTVVARYEPNPNRDDRVITRFEAAVSALAPFWNGTTPA